MMFSRRRFLQMLALGGAALLLPPIKSPVEAMPVPRSRFVSRDDETPVRLDPHTIPKFVEPLLIPPVMPYVSKEGGVTTYEIAARQFEQQILPNGYPKTTVWGYGSDRSPLPGQPGTTFNSPSLTVEVRRDEQVRVKWINRLVDAQGRYLPHLLPVDQTLHWANPPGPRDDHGTDPTPYQGPVPIVTHVHGAHVPDHSDGYPEAWYLPDANNIPAGYFKKGSRYDSVVPVEQGAAVFEYPNDQRAGTLWYHDHVLGITRLNVYAGLAGFWLIRDDEEDALDLPGPAPRLGDAPDTRYYEIPFVIQDRSFHTDGSLAYPTTREEFDDYPGPYYPHTPVPPIWNPEAFGDSIMVNGRTWPYLDVEARKYRFRIINGSQARFLTLKLDRPGMVFRQIGNEGGLLSATPVSLDRLSLGPAERADVIVDFAGLQPGQEVTLLNLAPDEPFKGPTPEEPQVPADPETTGRVLRFKVVALTNQGNPGKVPSALPVIPKLTTTLPARDLTLNEEMFEPEEDVELPIAALLGTAAHGPLKWADPATERPALGSTEIWRLANLTADAHPIHLHLVMFQVLDRIPFDVEAYMHAQEAYLARNGSGPAPSPMDYVTGAPMAPEPWENGWKDTVAANPNEITRIIATFDLPGLYVWHCHILEHEDNEMMRPYLVVPGPYHSYFPFVANGASEPVHR